MRLFSTGLIVFSFTFSMNAMSIAAKPEKDEKIIDISELKTRFDSNIRKYTLKNGLRVILMKNGFSPTIAAYLKVSTGSAEEPFDIAGTAHFLEHLLFKGTKTLGTRNFEREKPYLEQIIADGERLDTIERQLLNPHLSQSERDKLNQRKSELNKRMSIWQKGAAKFILSEEDSKAYSLAGQVGYNAYTTTDVTNYQIKLPKNRLELWAEIESSRFKQPVFREYYPERKVILEERRMRYDSRPQSLLYELYLKTAFGFSPYGKPVIGFASNIPRMRYRDTLSFFNNYYTANRMVISIVGDIEFEPTLAIVKKHFEDLPAGSDPEYPPIELDAQNGHRRAELVAEHTPVLLTGFKRPPVTHSDDIALEALSLILTQGNTSRLVKRLVIDEKIASSISSYSSLPGGKQESTFTIIASPFQHKDYHRLETVILEELNKIAENGVSDDELKKIKNAYFVSLVDSLSANAGLADSLSYAELIFGSYEEFFSSLEKMQKLESKQIQNAVKKYFKNEKRTTVYLVKPEQ